MILGNENYQPAIEGLAVSHGTYGHICGIDPVRDEKGAFNVLEDNGRCSSGVSYVVENRHMMMRAFPDLSEGLDILPVSDYGVRLHQALVETEPPSRHEAHVGLLSPGVYNSAYFEHIFLAREMDVPLVEGGDLFVENGRVYMQTIGGPARVIRSTGASATTFWTPRRSTRRTCRACPPTRSVPALPRRRGGLCSYAAHHRILS